MRVLLLHNRYRLEGGEERAVAEIARLLSEHGHEVELLERASARVRPVAAAHGMLAGGLDSEEVAAAVARFKPDVAHAHNLHPTLGWRALAAARAGGVRTVLHLHNFRLFCAIGISYREGMPCFRCHDGNTAPGVRLRCRGSLPEASVYGVGLHRQLPRLLEQTDRLVAVSHAGAARLRQLGLGERQIEVLPNFVRSQRGRSRAGEGRFALVAGRLVPEKGFDIAIAAAAAAEVPLVIAGTGPDEARLRRLAGRDVTFTGLLARDELARLREQAAVVLAPSRWEEPCPYSVLEALAAGVPVLASDHGGLPELVGDGLTLPVGHVSAWTSALSELWRRPDLRAQRGSEALERARERFGEQRYLAQLIDIYERS